MFSKYWGKGMVIGIVLLFFGAFIIPCINGEPGKINNKIDYLPITFGSQYIYVDWSESQTAKPIVPGGEVRIVDLNVSYGITRGDLLSQFIFRFFEGRQVSIYLEVVDTSPWCTARLFTNVLTLAIKGDTQVIDTHISIRLDLDAPAYEVGFVKLNAYVKPITGPRGLFTFFEGYEVNPRIEFTPDYVPNINVIPDSVFFKVNPGNKSDLPITVENLGNARTKVYAKIDGSTVPNNWIFSIASYIILDVGSISSINLTIRPPVDFYGTETIKLGFIPGRAENTEDRGEEIFIPITLYNFDSKPLSISVNKSPIYEGETLIVTALSYGYPVKDVFVIFNEEISLTDSSGQTDFIVPDPGVESAIYTITAIKEGYITTEKSITVLKG